MASYLPAQADGKPINELSLSEDLDFHSEIEPYDIQFQKQVDCTREASCATGLCVVFDFSKDVCKKHPESLKFLTDILDAEASSDYENFRVCTKLYIMGDWYFSYDADASNEEDPDEVSRVPIYS